MTKILSPALVALLTSLAGPCLGQVEAARGHLESLVAEAPNFTEAHVSLATVYYREKRKSDGDRERAIVEKLNAEKQAKEKGVNPSP